jgi:hypothetical protein
MKTSVYLVETVVSDLFIVSLSIRFLSTRVILIPITPLAISVLYRLEREYRSPRSPRPSIPRRHRYAPLILSNADVHSTHLLPPQAMGIAAVYTLSLVGTNVVFNKEQEKISNSFFSCTLALNAICTGTCLCIASAKGKTSLTFLAPHQVSLHSASGEPSSRHAKPRWAPTFRMSQSSSLNLVCFISPLSYDRSNLTCT